MQQAIRGAEELRREFDAAFAALPLERDETLEPLLLIEVTPGRRAALRIAELGGLHVCPPIVRLPGGAPPQLGVVGLRGKLAVAFGLPEATGVEPPARPGRWIALWGGDRAIGFVFHALEGHVLASRGRIRRTDRGGDAARAEAPADTVVELERGLVPLIELGELAAPLCAERAKHDSLV